MELLSRFIQRRPAVEELLRRQGHQPLREFLAAHYFHAPRALDSALLSAVREEVSRLHGETTASSLAEQLGRCAVAITADHVGPDTHSVLVQNKIAMLEAASLSGLAHVLILAGGCVPLNNRFSGFMEWEGTRFPIFPRKLQDLMACGAPGLTARDVASLPTRARSASVQRQLAALTPANQAWVGPVRERTSGFTSAPTRFARTLGLTSLGESEQAALAAAYPEAQQTGALAAERFNTLLVEPARPLLGPARLFADQMSALNTQVWSRWQKHPNVLFVQIEDVVSRVLTAWLGASEPHVMTHLLLHPSARTRTLGALRGVRGCWDYGQPGTQLFWGRLTDGRPAPLVVEGNFLRSIPRGDRPAAVEVALTREGLSEALAARMLVPAPFVSLTTLMLAGLECVGGINQALDYLPQMWSRLGVDGLTWGTPEESERLTQLRANLFSCGPLSFFEDDGEMLRPGSMDCLLRAPTQTRTITSRATRELSFQDALILSLPYLVGASEPSPTHCQLETLARQHGISLHHLTVTTETL